MQNNQPTHSWHFNPNFWQNNVQSCAPQPKKILVNPHFRPAKSVFVNPHFVPQNTNTNEPRSIHINPKFALNTITNAIKRQESANRTVVLTRNKLIRKPVESKYKFIKPSSSGTPVRKRRNSVKSRYKIVKSQPPKAAETPRRIIISRYKLTKIKTPLKNAIIKSKQKVKGGTPTGNKYKVDRRSVNAKKKSTSKPIVWRKMGLKMAVTSLITISGVQYTKSRNSLRRKTESGVGNKKVSKPKVESSKRQTQRSDLNRSRIVKKYKIIRKQSPKKVKSPQKMKKCNIPCPPYQKYGICKKLDIGRCFLKHDPDQIALCTRFLQGACLKEKCLLSHNVSKEKMPTCKYYLEGACTKVDCPYLHVKISSKAEICRDFLEGFCKKAAECDKRHQYLCPDFEKYGNCVKQRCQYPHGKMVRPYLMNKNLFAKKYSNEKKTEKVAKIEEPQEVKRYYNDDDKEAELNVEIKTFVGLDSRPKLGSLPSFIPFGES